MSGTLDNVTSWLPVGETAEEITLDATNLIGSTTLNGFTFGIAFTLYVICMHSLIGQLRSGTRTKQTAFTAIYITLMLVMGTVYCAVNSRLAQLEFVNFKNYPGGPTAYSFVTFDLPVTIVGLSAFFITNWMNDALLLWRLSVLYNGSRFRIPVIGLGVLMYLATFALGMVVVIESSLPNNSFFTGISVRFVTTYYALTTTFTIILTLLMSARIFMVRREIINATGSRGFATQYTGIIAMLIESSALYTAWGIIFLATYVTNNPVQQVFLATLSEVQTIAPLLIVYRVSQGTAWQSDTTQMLTTNVASTSGYKTQFGGSTRNTATRTMDSEVRTIRIKVDTDVDGGHDSPNHSQSLGKNAYEMGDV